MSYSFCLPEEEPVCECRYDESRDRMDREDCLFHSDPLSEFELAHPMRAKRKPFLAGHPHAGILQGEPKRGLSYLEV